MSLDTYDLSQEEFKKLFVQQGELLSHLLNQHMWLLAGHGLPDSLVRDPKFVWDSFSEVLYSTSEAARLIQKEKNPEAVKKRGYDWLDTVKD